MPWTFFLSRRYLFSHNGKKGHLGNSLAILGLGTGIMTLITVLTVMNGFQQGFISSINEIYSYHVRMEKCHPDPQALTGIPGIKAVVPFYDRQGIITSNNALSSGASLRFLDFSLASKDKGFTDKLTIMDGRLPGENEILLGRDLAHHLCLVTGDTLDFAMLGPSGSFQNESFMVSGVFSSSYYEYDRNMAFTALSDNSENNAARIIWGIKLKNHFKDHKVLEKLEELYPQARIQSWRQYNSAFFNALKIEKIFMFLVLALIFIVVAVNIFHSMKRNVMERIQELALLKAIGGRTGDLQRIYLEQALAIAFLGGLGGTVLGMVLSKNINETISFFIALRNVVFDALSRLSSGIIPAPMPFYFTQIPIDFFWQDIVLVNLCAFCSVIVAAWRATGKASHIYPGEILRNE